jgi:hippurate hydrolase
MNAFNNELKIVIQEILPQIKKLRKELHQFPETAWKEFETGKRILKALESCEKQIHKAYIETDIVFDMGDHHSADQRLLLRSDMDALAQMETGKKDYASKNPGAAHNCGHDGHMSMLTGAALVIDALIKKGYPLPRPVRFVFQPAEEIECGGAKLVSLGILENVENVMAIHGWPGLKKGGLFSKEGPFFAAAATFSTRITGKATHGGLPQNGLSPFPAVAAMIGEVERIKQQFEGKAIISLCRINGGSSDNIIPGTIELRGTIRYYDQPVIEEIKKCFIKTEQSLQAETFCSVTTEFISKYYKQVVNNGAFLKKLGDTLSGASADYPMIPGSINLTDHKTVSEDFAFYTDQKPGALILLGLGDETSPLHASDFDFPDEVLVKGILLFVTAAYLYQ